MARDALARVVVPFTVASLGATTAACGIPGAAPRSPAAWSESSLCDHDASSITVVDSTGAPIKGATVWTEARMREGASGMGEPIGWDIVRTGKASRTDDAGRVRFCDVTPPLLAEYGTTGWMTDGAYGRSWRSLVAVDLFVQVGNRYARARRFASRAWGTGNEFPLEPRLVVTLDRTVEGFAKPTVGRPSDEPLFDLVAQPRWARKR